MSTQLLLGVIVALLVACIALLVVLLRRQGRAGSNDLETRLALVGQGQERAERVVRDEIARSREESGRDAHLLRGELSTSLKAIDDRVFQNLGVLSTRQNEQLAQVMEALEQMTGATRDGARQLREEVGTTLKSVNDSVVRTMSTLSASNAEQFDRLRATVEGKLDQIRQDNTAKLEQVRQTVDEKLHGVLEQRLGESFSRVSERLEQVHRGLGEMQTLASGVGDLKKVEAGIRELGLGEVVRYTGEL